MHLSRQRQLAFLEDFALALGDGLSPLQCCQDLLVNARKLRLRQEELIAAHLIRQLSHGRALGTSLQEWFAHDLVMLVAVGENSGVLEQLLQQHRLFEVERQAAWREFWKPLLYPIAMMILAFGASLFIGRGVIPKLAKSLPKSDWPELSQWLLVLTHSLWLPILVSGVIIIFILVWGPPGVIRFKWSWCRWLAGCGAFMIQRYFHAVLLLQTLTVLLQSGSNLDKSLAAMQRYGSQELNYYFSFMRQQLAEGERKLERIFASGLLSPRMLFRLGNGSRNATEHGTLLRVAGYASRDALQALRRLRSALQAFCYSLIFALLIIVLGGMGSMLMAITQQSIV
ncbi:hypothetical protein CWI82_03705 [Pseudidiomarina tainanensis]|uniref:Uncharacterized protein n=1 Tax=Pseudidiomarina tainanensis TaxID=502365 RepID=A0ACD2HIN6_9GAMM|nr:type II secretion system F family protein [Pseudidiomarina tainanensis]RZQ56421.1 hypothetical protein CWI82_03705 [Pseudidiomarina tainanensis]